VTGRGPDGDVSSLRWADQTPTGKPVDSSVDSTYAEGRPVPKFLSISCASCSVTSASPRPESPGGLGSPIL